MDLRSRFGLSLTAEVFCYLVMPVGESALGQPLVCRQHSVGHRSRAQEPGAVWGVGTGCRSGVQEPGARRSAGHRSRGGGGGRRGEAQELERRPSSN